MEQQARVAFLRRQAQFLLYVFNKTELHQSQAWFEMDYEKKDKNKENQEKKIFFFWKTPHGPLFCINVHCYKYKLTNSGSGGYLASQLQEQDLNSAIQHLQEQELKKN